MPKQYRWAHPIEWLEERISALANDANIDGLSDIARACAGVLDSDTIQDIFQSDMDADGYFIPVIPRPDRYGRNWPFPDAELCPVCGQPDSIGDCNHRALTPADVTSLLDGEDEVS
jgi:hypothetical protein